MAMFASGLSTENPKSSFGMDFNGTRFGLFESDEVEGPVAQLRKQFRLQFQKSF